MSVSPLPQEAQLGDTFKTLLRRATRKGSGAPKEEVSVGDYRIESSRVKVLWRAHK